MNKTTKDIFQRPGPAAWAGALSGGLGGLAMHMVSGLDAPGSVAIVLGLAVSALIGLSVHLWCVLWRLRVDIKLLRHREEGLG